MYNNCLGLEEVEQIIIDSIIYDNMAETLKVMRL